MSPAVGDRLKMSEGVQEQGTDTRERKLHEDGKNYTMRSFIICTLHIILLR
jgi:hypothetical protein